MSDCLIARVCAWFLRAPYSSDHVPHSSKGRSWTQTCWGQVPCVSGNLELVVKFGCAIHRWAERQGLCNHPPVMTYLQQQDVC